MINLVIRVALNEIQLEYFYKHILSLCKPDSSHSFGMTKIHKIQAVQNISVDFGKVHVSQMDTRCYAHVVTHGIVCYILLWL